MSFHPRVLVLAALSASLAACSLPGFASSEGEGEGESEWYPSEDNAGDQFIDYGENPFVDTSEDTLSTFSVDVDTASYTIARRYLLDGALPPPESVRVEEFLNYFDYDYTPPDEDAFAVSLEAGPSQFGEGLHLLRIGIQGRVVPEEQRLPANLVFLIDVSGSMQDESKLGLVQFTLKSLVERLQPTDTLGIVVYAGQDAVLIEPTPVEDKGAILEAIDGLMAGGSTAGEAGMRGAYDLAESAFREGGINRVVWCTDGDFNVGVTGDALVDLIEDFRDRDIFLTALGFGMGNTNDATMEQLADNGNGNYAYIDSENEATRMVGEQLVSALQVIAKDVKVQVEFDPAAVSRFRLIGYENRVLEHDDFDDDSVDAGDIGAGHDVTALYEIELSGGVVAQSVVESTPIATVRLRHKAPDGDVSVETDVPLTLAERHGSFDELSARTRFAAAVTELAEILRESSHSEGRRFDDVRAILEETRIEGRDIEEELIGLVEIASGL